MRSLACVAIVLVVSPADADGLPNTPLRRTKPLLVAGDATVLFGAAPRFALPAVGVWYSYSPLARAALDLRLGTLGPLLPFAVDAGGRLLFRDEGLAPYAYWRFGALTSLCIFGCDGARVSVQANTSAGGGLEITTQGGFTFVAEIGPTLVFAQPSTRVVGNAALALGSRF